MVSFRAVGPGDDGGRRRAGHRQRGRPAAAATSTWSTWCAPARPRPATPRRPRTPRRSSARAPTTAVSPSPGPPTSSGCLGPVIGQLGRRLRPGPRRGPRPGRVRHPRRVHRLPRDEHRAAPPPRASPRGPWSSWPGRPTARARRGPGWGPRTSPTSTWPPWTPGSTRRLRLGRAHRGAAGRPLRGAAAPRRGGRPDGAAVRGHVGRDAEDGRNTFARPGGGTRVGERAGAAALRAARRPGRAGPGVHAVPGRRRLGDRRLGVRQRPGHRAHPLDRGRQAWPACATTGPGRRPPGSSRRRRSTT